MAETKARFLADTQKADTTAEAFTMPTGRASQNNYVLAMDNISTGSTVWQATATAPTITDISGGLNHDQDSTLTLFGDDFKNTTTVSLWNASTGGSQVGSNATITNQTATRLEATFGHGSLSAGDTVYVEANTSGINTRFASAFTVSADPTVTFTQGTGSGANTTNHLGTYGGRVAGGPQDSNTKLLLNFDRADASTDLEDSSNISGSGSKVTVHNGGNISNTTYKITGKTNNTSLGLYGSNDHVKVSNNVISDFMSETSPHDFTVDAWIYPTSNPGDKVIWGMTAHNGYHLNLGFHVSTDVNNYYGGFRACSFSWDQASTNPADTVSLSNNTWYHCLWHVHWPSLEPVCDFFLDGVYKGRTTHNTTSSAHKNISNYTDTAGSSNLYAAIGAKVDESGSDSLHFEGHIDRLRIRSGDTTKVTDDPLYFATAFSSRSKGTTYFTPTTTLYGAYKDKTIPTITFTGQLASGSLASDEDIEFSNVANTSITSGMQKLDDTKIGLTLTNLTGSDKNKATLTGTISDDFSGTTRANLPVQAQVRTERGNAAYDSTGSSKRLVTFSSTTKTTGLQPGYSVTGTGIPAGTTITSIDSATTLTLSQDTTGGALTSQTLHFGDPERVAIVNGSTTSDENDAVVMGTSDPMLTIAVDPETQPVLFSARRYVGNGIEGREITGFGFGSPDLVWIKSRNVSRHHNLFDSVKGVDATNANKLLPNENVASNTNGYGNIRAFTSDGFTLENGTESSMAHVNTDNEKYIAWAWKAGGAPSGALPTIGDGTSGTVTKGAGTIPDSSATNNTNIVQSVNRETGFSITKFNGDGGGGLFPHNLGATPDVVIVKKLTDDGDNQSWAVWHKDLTASSGYSLFLNTNAKEGSTSGYFDYNSTAHSSTNISIGSNDVQGGGDDDYICYAWKAVSGVSAFGTYEGRTGGWASDPGGNNGGAIDVGFKPRFLITKNIDTDSTHWMVFDSFREASDTKTTSLYPNLSNEENSHSDRTVIFDSNGFKFNSNTTHSGVNTSGDTYIYMAFA